MLGFDYLIISNQIFDPTQVCSTFELFSSIGVRNFCFTYSVDLANESLSLALVRIKAFRKELSRLCPRGCKAFLFPSLVLHEDVVRNPVISSFSVGSRMIFLEFPLVDDPLNKSWLNENLNYLIRKQNLSPLFLSFETPMQLSSLEQLDRFLRLSGLSFALDLNFLISDSNHCWMKSMLNGGISIFPSISKELFYYPAIERTVNEFSATIGFERYANLCRLFHDRKSFIL